VITAAKANLLSCEGCQRLYRAADVAGQRAAACSRCGGPLHARKPDSLNRTWALLIAALIFYIPANVFPVMTIIFSGTGAPSTILGGVMELVEGGDYPIALLILFASVAVPLAKISGLAYLLLSIRRRSHWNPRRRTHMYKIINAIGRWSMIDMFMVSILVAIVHLGAIATVEPGLGALAFATVVVCTIFAAESFDPRLVWDSMEEDR
jgi:paraquat-inducible protein A